MRRSKTWARRIVRWRRGLRASRAPGVWRAERLRGRGRLCRSPRSEGSAVGIKVENLLRLAVFGERELFLLRSVHWMIFPVGHHDVEENLPNLRANRRLGTRSRRGLLAGLPL